jgi:hypothetical protein
VQLLSERRNVQSFSTLKDRDGISTKRLQCSLLHNPSVVHDDDVVGELLGVIELVSGHEQGATAIPFGPEHFTNNPVAVGVDSGRRFVEHQDARPTEECESEQGALLLATAESAPRRSGARGEGELVE